MNNIIPWDYRIELDMTEEEYAFIRLMRVLKRQGKDDLIEFYINQIESKG